MSQSNNMDSVGSVVVGFVMAVGNHTFGWFNHILQVNGGLVNDWGQAFITGSIGAIGAFLTNRFIKYVEKKIKNKNENNKSH